jgi:hypothetical protein
MASANSSQNNDVYKYKINSKENLNYMIPNIDNT